MVRLIGEARVEAGGARTRFQFQNGSINREGKFVEGKARGTSFNSKMVRLIVEASAFETHFMSGFNSKMVRLIAATPSTSSASTSCFNSKMVRLIEEGYERKTTQAPFQFQNGSINSVPVAFQYVPVRCFNSKMVRLIAGRSCRIPTRSPVSIPKWFD